MKIINGQSVTIRNKIHPGDVGGIVSLHSELYANAYGFDHTFESYVAQPLEEFVKRHHPGDRLWIVKMEDEVMGAVAIVNCDDNIAQLRWLIVHPDLQGHGMGKKLVQDALSFCKVYGYQSVFLWTIDFLHAALKIYLSAGFQLMDTKSHRIWGRYLKEERYDLRLSPEK